MLKPLLSLLLISLISTSFVSEGHLTNVKDISQVNFRSGKDYALFFAVNDYQNERLRDLDNPISNATKIANVLEEHYGYETEVVKNPTYSDIINKLNEYKSKFAKNRNDEYQSKGQLMIFFSGHGEAESRNGYFLPADANPNNLFQSGFAYSIWRPIIDEIDCDHILVAIDACYSGLFDPGWFSKSGGGMGTRPGELSESEKLIVEHEKYKTRWFFTSGTDVKTPDQSRFVSKFLEGLRSWGGKDGILTSSELWTYIDQATPRPHQDEFGKNDGGSSFLFILKNPLQNFNLPTEDTNQMEKDLAAWRTAKQRNSIAAYQAYLGQFPSGEFRELAIVHVRRLEKEAVNRTEELIWDIAKEKNTPSAFLDYKNQYPNGRFVAEANQRINDLNKISTKPSTNSPDNMVFIKGGTFTMGCTSEQGDDCGSDEKPSHQVTVSDFYLNRTEVSRGEFREFINATAYQTTADKEGTAYGLKDGKWADHNGLSWKDMGFPQTDDHPAIGISWYDAVEYCNWKSKQERLNPSYTTNGEKITCNWNANGYRLPTEAEWEFAARSRGKGYKYAWGNGQADGNVSDEAAKKAYSGWTIWEGYNDGYVYTSPVGKFEQGDLGLTDMTGNVWEWCWDWYDGDYYKNSPQQNPKGADSGSNRVVRGGSWSSEPAHQRVAFRNRNTPSDRNLGIGFRISRAAL